MDIHPPIGELAEAAKLERWPAGVRICRAHSHLFGSAQLDRRPDADARFSTVRSARTVIPVLYGGENDQAAASETIFHTVDTPGGAHRPRQVALAKYISWQWSEVVTVREVALVRLEGADLDALGTSRAELIEGGRPTYGTTRAWAHALATARPDADGLWWMSRQAPDRWSVMLFGRLARRPGGVGVGDLTADSPAVPFAAQPGLGRLDQIADELEITIIRS